MLIGDKTGPAIIAHTYGDVRPEHLLKQAQRIRLTAANPVQAANAPSSIKSSNTSPEIAAGVTSSQSVSLEAETTESKSVMPDSLTLPETL